MESDVVAIVPAAGIGRRFGGSVRKIFVELKGVPLLVHTLRRLSDVESVSEIIPVLRKDDIELGLELVSKYRLHKVRQIAPGGNERQDSINNGLKLLGGECTVIVHDGARPIISEKLITELLENLEEFDGIIPVLPLKETIKKVDGGIVVSTVDREELRSVQTPQVFTSDVLTKAYETAYSEGFYGTGDASLVERSGGRVKVVPGDPFNIKITTQEDLDMVGLLMDKGAA